MDNDAIKGTQSVTLEKDVSTSFSTYLKQVAAAFKAGNATEHTHRPALKTLIEALGTGIVATNEPKRIKCGAPDFIVTRKHIPLGYIEAKDIGANLDEIEEDEQVKRYRASLRNLVLTDYLEFRLYRNGELVQNAQVAKVQKNGVLRSDQAGIQLVNTLLTWFLQADVPSVASPRELAQRMAWLAQLIRDLIRQTFSQEGAEGELHAQFGAFQKVLLADLKPPQFADMYAQTLCYGLFAARCNHIGAGFTREHAASELPKTNPFLRKLFAQIAGVDLDERISWAVDDLAELLARADMAAILEDFGKAIRQEDPVVHFYETFLSAYDPKERERRGVYYTPEPVVSYIVRSVDAILKRDFKLSFGLADSSKVKIKRPIKLKKNGEEQFETVETHRVQILDPATGTGTFLYFVIGLMRETMKANAGLWHSYVTEHLLPRVFGFELLMAPYAVAHMKLGLELKESGYDFASDERLRVYLTNTLEEAHELTGLPLFTQWLSQEAASASQVKRNVPIMVVLGNPPYSGHSANTGEWINGLLRGRDSLMKASTGNYFEMDGEPLGERTAKWLNNDYVKFIRFAQWRIEQTGYGVLAFITDNGYLDNPTFRGMRQCLAETFDDIYLLDLHGNSKKKEKAPDGGKDENVFDIQQGVAIGIFVKRHTKGKSGQLRNINHAEIWGVRASKYAWLYEHDIVTTAWEKVSPTSPMHYFVPKDSNLTAEFGAAYPMPNAFVKSNTGIITKRDALSIHFTAKELWDTVQKFASMPAEQARAEFNLPEDVRDWKVSWAQEDLKTSGLSKEKIKRILYRPFDIRFIYYTGKTRGFVGWPYREFMSNMFRDNYGLILTRQTKDKWDIFATKDIVGHKSLAAYDVNYLFPLYLYLNEDLLGEEKSVDMPNRRQANLRREFVSAVSEKLGLKYRPDGKGNLRSDFGPEDILHYTYGIFYAPSFRNRYGQFLKTEFPRLPLTSNSELFKSVCAIGARLFALHVLDLVGPSLCVFPVPGNNRVDKVEFGASRVYINAEQYFEEVPDAVWSYHVGGFQVASKWLKDRKGRLLSHDDCTHYMRIVSAVAETIRLQSKIDEAIPRWPIQ